jgi:Zn-dependent peptidase ImmA (M78 family)/formiminotetrahydrofolate cyclodeaminase
MADKDHKDERKLIEIPIGELLLKFGAGEHKPGSGSASALQGMLSAQMIRTVIDLTTSPKHSAKYTLHIPQLKKIKNDIEDRIYPELVRLFQEDSDHFDIVIKLREERNAEQDTFLKKQKTEAAIQSLKPATEIPLQIAEYCQELGDYAVFVFDNGFKSARGDSEVAINMAISGIVSCLSIVELNLLSIPSDEWLYEIRKRKARVKANYLPLSVKGPEKLAHLEKLADNKYDPFYEYFEEFRLGNLSETIKSPDDIEKLVSRLQNVLWKHKDKIWHDADGLNQLQVLDPEAVFSSVLGYTFLSPDFIDMHEISGERFETAGLIDKNKKHVQVSKNFQPHTRRFTAAHELGHAIMHRQAVLHRDRPLDGSSGIAKDPEEMQADRFAACFLMPAKPLRKLFSELFGMPRFVINESTAIALREAGAIAFQQKYDDLRKLSRRIATADYYGGKSFNPLYVIFGVSLEAMAIRLEELGLIR